MAMISVRCWVDWQEGLVYFEIAGCWSVTTIAHLMGDH